MNNDSADSGWAWQALVAACDTVDLDDTDARPLRLGRHALFHLPAHDLVVRITRSPADPDDARKALDVARWLARQQFPAAQPTDHKQPVDIDGHAVTFWQSLPGNPADRADIGRLGAALWILHGLEPPEEFTLPPQDVIGRTTTRVRQAAMPEQNRTFLLDRLNELGAQLTELRFPLVEGPVHGAARIENLIVHGEQTILTDFEEFAWGQPEWDLATTATEHLTTGRWTKSEYAHFVEAYGWDVTDWDGYPTLRATIEITLALP